MDTLKEVNSIFEQPWWLNIVAPNQWKEIRLVEDGIFLRWVYCKKGGRVFMPKNTQSLGLYLCKEGEEKMANYN